MSVYELFKSVPGSQIDMIKTLFKITEVLPVQVVESSLLTFLLRVKDVDDQEVSPQYKKLLLQCSMRIGRKY